MSALRWLWDLANGSYNGSRDAQNFMTESAATNESTESPPEPTRNHYSLMTEDGRNLSIYADTPEEALEKARRDKFLPIPSSVKQDGYWDAEKNMLMDDSTPVVVEGDVHARPQKKPAPEPDKSLNGSTPLNGAAEKSP
jgi:hypothetical protein